MHACRVKLRAALGAGTGLLIAASLAACGDADGGGPADAAAASRIAEATARAVTYEVRLDPRADTVYPDLSMTADLTMRVPGGTSQHTAAVKMADVVGKVPAPYLAYSQEVELAGGTRPYLSAQNTTDWGGAVTCIIWRKYQPKIEVTSTAVYGIATCTE